MLPERFEDILSEKTKLINFLQKLSIDLENLLENFENVNLDVLNKVLEDILDQEENAKKIKNFYNLFIKFKDTFKNYVLTFDDSKRFRNEIFLEDFIDDVLLLKENLLKFK